MSNKFAERRLLEWAVIATHGAHDPSWNPVGVEHRMMTEGVAVQTNNRRGDGRMTSILSRQRYAVAELQRAYETHNVVRLLKQCRPDEYAVLSIALTDRPGYVVPGRTGATKLGISGSSWRIRYSCALAFVDGALATTG